MVRIRLPSVAKRVAEEGVNGRYEAKMWVCCVSVGENHVAYMAMVIGRLIVRQYRAGIL